MSPKILKFQQKNAHGLELHVDSTKWSVFWRFLDNNALFNLRLKQTPPEAAGLLDTCMGAYSFQMISDSMVQIILPLSEDLPEVNYAKNEINL